MNNGQHLQNKLLTTSKITQVKGKAARGEPAIECIESTSVNGDELLEQEVTYVPHCACGAIIKPEDLVGIDASSGELVCPACSEARCKYCGKVTSLPRRVDSTTVSCKSCELKLALLMLAMVVALGVITFIFLR